MLLSSLQAFSFPVPFKVVFKHSSATRNEAANFIVQATGNRSKSGYGEGCPRKYVTGEDVNSCRRFLTEHTESIIEQVQDVASLRNWIAEHQVEIDTNPSAFCAIELAILDLLGVETGSSIEELLELPSFEGSVRYSAVLGNSPYPVYWMLARNYIKNGFRDIKIKISGNVQRDQHKLGFWKKHIERDFTVRLDANNLWQSADDCIQHLQLIPRTFWAIEEPLQPRDFDGLQAVASALDVRVILDESCINVADLQHLTGEGWICNLRVSKMGGIIRSTQFANAAKQRNVNVVVGAHVGETSLLTRASLAVVQHLENEQLAVEGAFGTHLLSEDLTSPCIMFDDNAQISLDSLAVLRKPGLGLFVEPDRLVPLDG